MPTEILKDDVRQLLEDGAQIVDVLPYAEYEEEHLPSAHLRQQFALST